jgi:hypothetical protein
LRPSVVLLLAVCVGFGAYKHFFNRSTYEAPVSDMPAPAAPALVATAVPLQENLPPMEAMLRKDGFRLTPLARFNLTARVLAHKTYCCGGEDRLAPVDIAFGWGRMTRDTVLASLEISQGGRFYHYRWQGNPPIPPHEIVASSANMHLIPSSAAIEKKLREARVGQTVTLAGFLVRAENDRGFVWMSSLSREDTGNGACELIWVTDVDVRDAAVRDAGRTAERI